MSQHTTADYFRRRESRQRTMAATAVSADIRAIHLELADRYAALAADTAPMTAERLMIPA